MNTGPERNELLAALPQQAQERVFPKLREIELPLGKEIYAAGQEMQFVYFPVNCIISLLYVMLDGASAEISVVGREGIVGIAVFMGGESTPSRAIIQSAGSAYRLPASELKAEFNNDPAMRMLMLRYTQALITQMAQTAVCNLILPAKNGHLVKRVTYATEVNHDGTNESKQDQPETLFTGVQG